jgi:uncharacterized protein (DUF433 family)
MSSDLSLSEAVSKDPQVMSGEIVFAGTRVPIWMLFDHIRHGHSLDQFFLSYPGVSPGQVDAVLARSLEEIQKAVEHKAA